MTSIELVLGVGKDGIWQQEVRAGNEWTANDARNQIVSQDTRKMLEEIWKQKWENYRQKHVDGPPAIAELRDLEDEKPAPKKRDHNSCPG
jgi:hypothetical protein